MQLIQIDSVEPEPFQAFVDTSFKIFRSTIGHPLSWPGSGVAALRRNNKAFRVRIKRFGNQQFARVRTIGISSIDQVHAEFDGASQNFEGTPTVRRPSPNSFSRQTHRAKTKPVDYEIAAQLPGGIRSDVW